ncbi:MAG: hemerythrin family protein [Rhodocyclaceae bacterium]|nr:hemerythrin family protein [Rhodocyclaceae bacterium]
MCATRGHGPEHDVLPTDDACESDRRGRRAAARDAVTAVRGEHEIQQRLLRSLAAVLAEGSDTAEMLRALVRYSGRHFAGEEAAMRDHRYPEEAAHLAEHRTLRAQLESLRVIDPSTEAFVAAFARLAATLRAHVAGADARLLTFLERAGAARCGDLPSGPLSG